MHFKKSRPSAALLHRASAFGTDLVQVIELNIVLCLKFCVCVYNS